MSSGAPVDVLVALGSNIKPRDNLPAAVAALREQFTVRAVSPVYESPAWGRTDQPAFFNAAVRLQVDAATRPAEFKQSLRAIEADLGRVRDPADPSGPRTIDLDLSVFGSRQFDQPPLPDPDIVSRWYIAVPLADIAGEVTLPGDGRTLAEVAASLAESVDGEPADFPLG